MRLVRFLCDGAVALPTPKPWAFRSHEACEAPRETGGQALALSLSLSLSLSVSLSLSLSLANIFSFQCAECIVDPGLVRKRQCYLEP